MSRKIKRDDPVVNRALTDGGVAADNETADRQNADATPESPAPETPVVVAGQPAEVSLDVSFQLPGGVSATGIRVVNGFVIYNEGVKMRREPIVKGVPITVTMRQEV